MPRAVIFDFNGVVIDDERSHYVAFQRLLRGQGLELGEEEYFARYLGLDDRGFVRTVFADKTGRTVDGQEVMDLVDRKAALYLEEIETGFDLFPGAADLIRALARELPLAIASGARRKEIELVLAVSGLAPCFRAIVSADDVTRGKPDPEGYTTALSELRRTDGCADLRASECVVIEDAPHGIRAAHAAGMRCVGVTHSRPESELGEADAVLTTLTGLDARRLDEILA